MMRYVISVVSVVSILSGCQCGAPGAVCKTSFDCVDTGKAYCAPALETCVECLEDAQCAEGFVCNAQGTCEAGCRSDADRCTLGSFCIAGQGCVECTKDSQCGIGRVCGSDHHCKTGCSADQPKCPSGEVCNVAAGVCVECGVNADCVNPSVPVCDPATQTCVGCVDNRDCHDASKPLCDPVTHTCAQCIQDAQCPAGQVCRNDACIAGCTAQHPCPIGSVCNPQNGQCVACVDDGQCGGATPKCDVATHTCVQCLPGAADTCAPGEYCRTDFVCERGCKGNSDCPSGQCKADHSCSACSQDAQCAAGQICSAGTCIAACSKTNPCGTGKECCGGRCQDLSNDPNNCGGCNLACGPSQACCNGKCAGLNTAAHCGACGTSCSPGTACCGSSCTATNTLTDCGGCGIKCGADQFCDGLVCHDVVFPEFCANKKVYVILDGIARDNAATNVLVSTVQANCSTQTQIFTGPQTNAAWVDQTTGALLLGGGSTVVTAGGPVPNKVVKWLETTRGATKVYYATNAIDTFYFKLRSTGAILASKPNSYCTAVPRTGDVFMVELVTDPASGTLVLISYGLCSGGYGTQAGAWFWANTILPNRTQYPDGWYLFEWTDTNGDLAAGATDTFTKLASGR